MSDAARRTGSGGSAALRRQRAGARRLIAPLRTSRRSTAPATSRCAGRRSTAPSATSSTARQGRRAVDARRPRRRRRSWPSRGPLRRHHRRARATTYRYAVAAVDGPGASRSARCRSRSTRGQRSTGPPVEVAIAVDAGRRLGAMRRPWRMVGSERLSQLDVERRDRRRADRRRTSPRRCGLARDELGVDRGAGPRHPP